MTTKAKRETPDVPDMRVHIKLMTDEKTIVLDIEDLAGCVTAKGLNKDDAKLLHGLSDLLQDIHASNTDASHIKLTPKNVEKVLGAEPLDDEPSGDEEKENVA